MAITCIIRSRVAFTDGRETAGEMNGGKRISEFPLQTGRVWKDIPIFSNEISGKFSSDFEFSPENNE